MFSRRASKQTHSEHADDSPERADRAWDLAYGELSQLTREWSWRTNAEHRLVFVSDRARSIVNVDPCSWLGRSLAEIAAPDCNVQSIRRLRADQRAGRPFRDIALSIVAPDGPHEMRVSGDPIFDDAGTFAGHRGIAIDVTGIVGRARETDSDYRQLLAALQHIPVGFILYDREDRLVLCNNFFRRLYPQVAPLLVPGTKFEVVEGEIARLGLVSDAKDRVEEWLAERLRDRTGVRRRLVRALSDGRWILINEIRTPTGDTVSVHQDITVPKQREVALRRSEQLFSMAFHHSPGMTAIAEVEDGTLIDVNEKWLKTYGWSHDHVIGKSVLVLGIWADPGDRERFVAGLKAEGRVRDQESQHRTKDGTLLDVVMSGEIIELDGKPRMLVVGHDVTDRKRAELEVRRSEARFSGILNIAPEAIIAVDAGYRITLFSDGAERTFGYRSGEVMGRSLGMLIPDHLRDSHRCHVRNFEDGVESSRIMAERSEVLGRRRDGTLFPCEASISKFEIDGEKIFTVLLHDITSRREFEEVLVAAKEEAELASRAKSEFLANMSHELRTPLNAILGFSQVIRDQNFGPVGNAKYLEYIEDILTSGEHLLEIIGDILDMAKLDAGHEILDNGVVDLGDIVRTSVRLMREQASRAGVRLNLEIDLANRLFYGDARKMKQILINLLSNAIKFTGRDGLVSVLLEASPDGGRLLTVRDNGIGIERDQIPRILEPFTQIEGPMTRQHDGTGLGLPLVKRYCELHGGVLGIQSVPGQGTTVRVRFPNSRTVTPGSAGQPEVEI